MEPSSADPTLLESNEEDFLFFHTSFTEPSSSLLIECVITRHEGQGGHKVEQASGGFAICTIFDFPQSAQAVIVQSGSPRMYGSVSTDVEQRSRIGKTMLTYEFQKFVPFEKMSELVP